MLGLLNRSIVHKTEQIMLPLYKSLIRPLLEYCIPAWSPHYQRDKHLIERIQHKFTRMVKGYSVLDYDERLNRLHLWSLEERRNRADLIEMYKISHQMSAIKLQDMFQLVPDSRTRGHPLKLYKHRSRLDLRRHFFSERVVDRWNSLDEDTVSSASVNAFKSRLGHIRQKKMGFFTDH